jgi:hypothetical protein
MANYKNDMAKKINAKRDAAIPKKNPKKAAAENYMAPSDILKKMHEPKYANAVETQINVICDSDIDAQTAEFIAKIRLDCLRLAVMDNPSLYPQMLVQRAQIYERFVFGAGPETAAQTRKRRGRK